MFLFITAVFSVENGYCKDEWRRRPAGYLFENPFPPCGDALSQSSTNGKIVNSSSASVLEKFGACIAESGRLVASLEEAYRPSGGTETTPHGENPRTKRAKLSQFVNDLEAMVSEMKLIFASSGCTDPFSFSFWKFTSTKETPSRTPPGTAW